MDKTNMIKNLDELLKPALDENFTIAESTTKPLTAAGENYGSLMLGMTVKLKNKKAAGKEKSMTMVAKLCPPNEFLKTMFNTGVTFKKEIATYTKIFPTLKAFQKEQGVSKVMSFFPDCYGARISLDPKSDTVDDDAVLLLENIKLSGFEMVDRMKGFNLETTQLLMKDLAVFHAVPVALKQLKPDVFKQKILPHLWRNDIFDAVSDKLVEAIIDFILETAKCRQECIPFIPNVDKSLRLCLHNLQNGVPPREPFATLNHNDYWVNNTMLKFENNNPTENKMVDFQLVDYGSPGKDILFLLYTSVQKEVVDSHYDSLLKLYYDTFIKTLKDLKCDTAPFTFKLFQEEIDFSAKSLEFFHILVMVRHVFAIKGKVKELSDLTEEDFATEAQISDQYRKKVPDVIMEFAKRKWI